MNSPYPYSRVVRRLPAAAIATVAGIAAFLGASVTGVGLLAVDSGEVAVRAGLGWGMMVALPLTVLGGALALLALPRWRGDTARGLVSAAMSGAAGIALGAWIGAVFGTELGLEGAARSLAQGLPTLWPQLALPLLLAAAAWATRSTPPSARSSR